MNTPFKVGRLGATYCWRVGSLHRNAVHASRVRCLQKRHYADRNTIDDLTQSRIEATYKVSSDGNSPSESPWRDGHYPKDLNDIGYEAHCNDRLYMAKNIYRHSKQEYDQKRQERRLEAQKRIQKHFNSDDSKEGTRRLNVVVDPAEHQKRQKDIIELNRRKWHGRQEAQRETNSSGVTYRPDLHKQLVATSQQKYLDMQRERERAETETTADAEAETNWWIRKQMGEAKTKTVSQDSTFEKRMKRLMGKYNAEPEAEKAEWHLKRPKREAEENWLMGGQARDSALQARFKELMGSERKPEAEEGDWDCGVRKPSAKVDEGDWDCEVRGPKAKLEEGDWDCEVRGPKAKLEEGDWDCGVRKPSARVDEGDWDCDMRKPSAKVEEGDWDCEVRGPKAKLEEGDWDNWRLKKRSLEAQDKDRRVKNQRAEAEEDWRMRSRQSSGLHKRLMRLMEAEKKPEAEEEDWRMQNRKSEAENSPSSDAEYSPTSPSKSWQKKQEKEAESQYWHSWHTCPSSQEVETNVEMKPHKSRKKVMVPPPSDSRGGQRRGYHQTALSPQPAIEAQPEPLANAPHIAKPLRIIPKKEKKSKPKRKRERKSVEPPRFKMTIKTRPGPARRPTPVPSCLRRLNVPSEVAGPRFHMANLEDILLNRCYAG